MAVRKKDASSPRIGMNRDSAVFELQQAEYTFALNANIHDEHGSGQIVIQNEPSNVKCSGFKAGYKVVGHKYDGYRERVYFFLTNPSTGFSEIGYIEGLFDMDPLVPNEIGSGNTLAVQLETPLENVVQVGSCNYTTMITDDCAGNPAAGQGCLNFSTEWPIHESNVHIKHGKLGDTMWFTDGWRNPMRYLKLYDLASYSVTQDPCDDTPTTVCLDCEKMRMFPLFEKPCLTPTVIQNGGNLRAGMIEVIIAYSNSEGEELSDYYSLTNPIPIFDKNNTVLDQTQLDYFTNQAIEIQVSGLDNSYEYYKIVVINRSGLDSAVTYVAYGVYPIDQSSFTIYDLQGKERVSAFQLSRRPFYTNAKGLAVANGYLYPYGLKARRTINLQPVVNLMGSLARWVTYQAEEDLYEDGINIANYATYMRDEVYPFSIQFDMTGGQELPLFPFIPRPPKANEIEVLGSPEFPANDETDSVLTNNPDCFGNDRDRRWQFENTAEELEDCVLDGYVIGTKPVTVEVVEACIVSEPDGSPTVVDTVATGTVTIDTDLDIVSYINNNTATIIAGTDPEWADIKDVLEDPTDYLDFCTVDFDTNCVTPATLVFEEIFAIAAETETSAEVSKDLADYVPSSPPSSLCSMYYLDAQGDVTEDTSFQSDYMDTGEVVYNRNNPSNNVCTSAAEPAFFTSPQVDTNYWLDNRGQIGGINTLQDTRDVTSTQSDIVVTLTGTSGTANVNVDGINYLATYNTNLNTTAVDFVTTHAAAILGATGLTVTASGATLVFTGPYAGFFLTTVTNATGNLAGTSEAIHFTDKLHKNAIWFKVPMGGYDGKIFELGTTACQYADDNTNQSLRISVFTDCAATGDVSAYSAIVADMSVVDVTKFLELSATDFGGPTGTAYIAIDSPIRTRSTTTAGQANTLTPPCDCFPVYQRLVDKVTQISFTNLTFGKRQEYETTCDFSRPILNDCGAVPYKKGLFSYWESVEKYPCNKELFDSSELNISQSDIPTAYQAEFESYYVDAVTLGQYTLSADTDFRDKSIRHYKFPDNIIAPFMSTYSAAPDAFGKSVIYPIGFHIDNEVVNAFLDIAVNNGLLTQEERDSITGYTIFRGDRRVQKSVIAKGLAYDMYQYSDEGKTINYPNYPLNTLGTDQFNLVNHPYGSFRHNFFTFHSPETSFYRPTLPREIRVEGYQFGASANYFDEVHDHPTYVIPGQSAYTLATSLAIAEVAFEILLQSSNWLVSGAAGGVSAPAATVIAITAVASLVASITFKTGEYRYKWLDTITNLGHPQNFAYYQVSVGHYNYFRPNDEANQALRGLTLSAYMKDGRISLTNEIDSTTYYVNNLDREYSVALHTGNYHVNYPAWYSGYDNYSLSPTTASRRRNSTIVGKSGLIQGRAASPYVSLKQYLPAQYGEINSITWISTGFCGDLSASSDCDAVFGGDITISRFSLKRKLPFFRTTAFGLAPLTPFKYSDYFNINPTQITNRYYIDYEINDDASNFLSVFVFPSNESNYNLDPGGPSRIGGFYVKPPNKFYLYSYGIPYFLVESEINCNFRYAKREAHENFYPNISDVVEWTQQKNVSIRQPNTFFYNTVYSAGHTPYPYSILPTNYAKDLYDRLNDLSNTTIYSAQDVSENSLVDPWLRYRALDSYTFSKSNGNLISISGIESQQLLARFTDSFTIFGAVDLMRDRLTPETENLGNGGIFAGRPVTFNTTELGYAGAQNQAKVSCEFGHFWPDTKRGKFFQLMPGGQGLKEISRSTNKPNSGLEKWFKENLPFKILKYLPTVHTDNNYNGVGIAMTWDDRFKRVFVTKKDYIPADGVLYNEEDRYFYIIDEEDHEVKVYLQDTDYFQDCSWTLAYSPLTESWISYYSFKPNYYVSHNDFFQSGINVTADTTEFGVWSHLAFNSSYQVFYGKLYPFTIEYPVPSKLTTSMLNHVEYWLDVRKYYNKYDFTDIYGVGFNKAVVYNNHQNTGQLNLVHQADDDIRQHLLYPAYNTDSIDILQSEMNGRWTFNHLYNIIRNERSGLPIWLYDCPQVEKSLDHRLLNYTYQYSDYLRGDYFLVRLTNDANSRFKFLFRMGVDDRTYYEQ